MKLLKSKNDDDFKPQMFHKIAVCLHPAMKNLNGTSDQDKIEIIDHRKLLIDVKVCKDMSHMSYN